ncbi:MAG: HEAT repeat domain-containing protein [Chloroflexia bacterium]
MDFGCDICQDVSSTAAPRWWTRRDRARPGWGAEPDLIELMGLTDEEFRERFRGSPVKRTKRRGLLRNVAVALGNSGDPRAIPALVRALGDHEPLVRGHAAWALGRYRAPEARAALEVSLSTEGDEWVREEIGLSIGATAGATA